jgi:hypothetical protein
MKINEVIKLKELDYPGNIGMMEMAKFFQIADDAQKTEMRRMKALLVASGDRLENMPDGIEKDEESKVYRTIEAGIWHYIQKVTKMTLQDK